MGELTNLNPLTITDGDIPALIARDSETTAAIAAHEAKADPHPVYLTQAEGDGRYRQSTVALVDADIPAAIARDSETTAAIAGHTALADPHPGLWTRITQTFLRLTGGQQVLKNNPAMASDSFLAPKNHLELATTDGSNPIIGFHKAGISGTALYHAGYGNDSLRVRNADGFDGAIIHDGNIEFKVAGGAKASILDDNKTIRTKFLSGVTAPSQGAGVGTPHGLVRTKIVGVQVIIHGSSLSISAGFRNAQGTGGAECHVAMDVSNLYIQNSSTNSINVLGMPWTALITYLP